MTAITYNWDSKDFTVRLPSGRSLEMPTRAIAEYAYLEAVAPELARRVASIERICPDVGPRARRAAALVLGGAVRRPEPDEVLLSSGRYHYTPTILARVGSQLGGQVFMITQDRWGLIVCNCPDGSPEEGEEGAPPSKLAPKTCKHILAMLLAQ